MTSAWRRSLMLLCMLSLLAMHVAFAPAAQSDGDAPAAWKPWQTQLEALSPNNPLAYIELAEDMLDAAESAEMRTGNELRLLAQQLIALAGSIDSSGLGRSACLALAELSTDKFDRERFSALANLLPSRDVLSTWSPSARDEPISPSVALALSEALGYYRQGYGNRALSTLQRQDTEKVLARFGHLLPGGPQRFLEDCKHYVNAKKPPLFESDITRLLSLEAALLSNTERSWAGEMLLTGGTPLIEIDPDQLDEMLDVDVTRPYFVNGSFERVPARR